MSRWLLLLTCLLLRYIAISRIRYLSFSFTWWWPIWSRCRTFHSCHRLIAAKYFISYLCGGTQFIQPYGLSRPSSHSLAKTLSSAGFVLCVRVLIGRGGRSKPSLWFFLNLLYRIVGGLLSFSGRRVYTPFSLNGTTLQWLGLTYWLCYLIIHFDTSIRLLDFESGICFHLFSCQFPGP